MNMRPSKVLRKLRAGELVNCVKINLNDSRSVEIAGLCGFDCVWLDMEHVPNDYSLIEKMILAGKATDTDVMVRTARGGYNNLIKPLELDATGIMVPHMMSLEDAKWIARTSRFHPVGRRPVDGGNNDGAYCLIDFNQYLEEANRERFVIVQVEDPEPVAELEAICQVPGIDMIFFGPGDFSQGIGTPGKWDNPEIDRVRRLVAKTARKYGKFAGTVGGLGNMDSLAEMGYQFISVGADVVALSSYYSNLVNGFKGSKAVAAGTSIYSKD